MLCSSITVQASIQTSYTDYYGRTWYWFCPFQRIPSAQVRIDALLIQHLCGYIYKIYYRKWQKDEGREVGDTYLFTGCRNKAIDHIYEEELDEYSKTGVLTENFVAFSRDTDKKVYVQHILKEKKQLVWDCINKNGNIYVCG